MIATFIYHFLYFRSVRTEAPCPDLVGQNRSTGECIKLHPQLFCPLPDVSSIGQSTEVETPGDTVHKSTESSDGLATERKLLKEDMALDTGDLDYLLNAKMELNPLKEDHKIPDCIIESVMNDDSHRDDMPVAFSESIGQRVGRQRRSRRSDFEQAELANLVQGSIAPNSNLEQTTEEESKSEGLANNRVVQELSHSFDGDWPTEMSLEQRPLRKRDKHKIGEENEGAGVSQNDIHDETNVHVGPKLTEFQKLINLIQTGVPETETIISPLSSSCSNSESGDLEQHEASRGDFEKGELDLNGPDRSVGELPDCVLGWKASESCTETYCSKESTTENKEDLTSVYGEVFDSDKETSSASLKSVPLSDCPADVSKFLGANSQNIECGLESGLTDLNTETLSDTPHGIGSHISHLGSSADLETEGGNNSVGSQDRKQSQGRRSGKQCKLALTFTQNCPGNPLNTLECSSSSSQSEMNTQESVNMDSGQGQTSKCSSTVSQESSEALIEVKSAQTKPLSPTHLLDHCFSTQTEPQDFAVLWRLNQNPSVNQPADIRVLFGNSFRFEPHLSPSGSTAALPSIEVPYCVVHEKGTQVEETELGATQDRLGGLCILRRHFKEVTDDTLLDLYDKCHQDLDWTTNLLLDSGEMFSKEEECEIQDENCNTSICREASERPEENSLFPNEEDESHVEHLVSELREETLQASPGTRKESNKSASNNNDQCFKAPLVPLSDMNVDNPHQKELSDPAPEHKIEQDSNQENSPGTGSYDDDLFIEGPRFETEEDIASMNEVLRVLQEELDKLEGEEKHQREWTPELSVAAARRRGHLDIQSVELKLPTEVALQLTELFGPVGIDPGNEHSFFTCRPFQYRTLFL